MSALKMMDDVSLNNNAARILEDKVIPCADALRIGVSRLQNGATVIDMGVQYPGGWQAARYFVEVGLAGMGQLEYGRTRAGRFEVPSVKIKVTQPVVSEMAAHVAYWKLPYRGAMSVISGPVRSIKGADKFACATDYRDQNARSAVACIQTEELPDEELTNLIAEGCGIPANKVYILAARTGTLVGAVQVCARNVEQTLPSLYERRFPLEAVVQANGVTPIVSVVDNEEIAYGRVNDCLIYGQESNIYVRCDDDRIISILENLTFDKNTDVYGLQFQGLFARCGNSWANVPRDWDAPCKVNFINLKTGRIFTAGRIGQDVLEKSYLGEE